MGSYSPIVNVSVPARHNINIQNGLIACFTTALFVYYYHFFRKSKRIKLLEDKPSKRKIPGPGQHFLGAVANILALRDHTKFFEVLENWGKQYGPVIQLNFGPYNITTLNSPEYVKKLLGSTDTNYMGKGFAYKPFKPFWDDGIIISKGDKWKNRRRVLEKHMFSYKSLASYMDIFNEQGDTLIQTIDEKFHDGKEHGIEQILFKSSLQSIIRILFGKSLDDFESLANCEISYMECLCRAKELMTKRILTPYLLNDFIMNFHPLSKLQGFLTKIGRKYVLSSILDESARPLKNHDEPRRENVLKDELAAAGVPLEGIIEETQTLIGAG
ncbi:unnamed protein product [Orchesella dallaii]|uniref:Cytochrome P450 4C1 n=1 Tax=Orchesella dallaii TaxID=48710 RepID=A0ABP1RYI6_9HEXA